MRDNFDTLSEMYEDMDIWLTNYREASPDDERDDIDIYLDATVYKPNSPYWPLRDVNGTLIDWQAQPL